VVKKVKVFGSGSEVANSNISIFNSYQTNPSTITNIGSFLINTNNSSRVINDTKKLTNFSSNITIDSLKLNQDQITSIINKTTEYIFNVDKSNLLNYAKYGSLFERFKAAVNTIITTFPGSLYINGLIDDFTSYNTVNNNIYDENTDTSTFNVNLLSVKNKFNLNINNSSLNNDPSNHELKNLPITYGDYVLFVNNTEYNVLSFSGLTSTNNTTLYFKVKGKPFSGSTSSVSYHIKPNKNKYTLFYSGLDYFEQYLLNKDTTPIYTVNIKIPILDEENDTIIYNNKTLTWSISDGYNIDIDTISFQNYYKEFIDICGVFDLVKSDLINRMLMTQSVIITDNSESNKSVQISRILGREIDEIKRYVDGLQFVNTLTYDKIDNTSDILIKSIANTLGFQHFNFIEIDDVFESMFNTSVSGTSGNSKTPSELDIELWRNILINTNHLFKSKGTRQGIESVFALLGLPDAFLEINEHVYTVEGVINPNDVDLTVIYPLNETLTRLPYDDNGYPVAGNEVDGYWFQMNGNEDRGQAYIDVYRKLGFKVSKQIDNRKSWVYSTGQTRHSDSFSPTEVDYLVNDSKLIINSKEISIFIDPVQAIENDIYTYNKSNNYPISSTGRVYPYPNRDNTKINVNNLSFNQYVFESYSNFINAQNRKTITSANGISYPSLYKLYEDYLLVSNSNKYTLQNIYKFIEKFQNLYQKLISQLLSSTVIIGEDGMKVKNLVYTQQKFDYKNGIDVSSEFKTNQPLDLNASLKSLTTISGVYKKPIINNTYLFQSYGNGSFNGTKGSTTGNSSVINSNTNNLLGLIKPQQHFSSFIVDLDIPTITISGATKIDTIGINNSVFYYDNLTGHTLQYTVIDNLPVLQNNNNTFNYEIFSLDKTITGFTNLEIVVNTDYKSFTGSSVFTDTLEKSILSGDTEYIIKPYFTYKTNLLTGETINYSSLLDSYNLASLTKYPLQQAYYNYYFDNNIYYNYTGHTYSTKSDGVYNLPYYYYNEISDWYFVSVKNPDKPVVQTTTNTTNTQQIGNLYTENIIPNNVNTFTLTYQPAGDIKLSVNGSTLQKNTEYVNVTTLPGALAAITYKLLIPFNVDNDLLTVTYIINSGGNSLASEYEFIDYIIPSGTTRGSEGRVFYDTASTYYSYLIDVTDFNGTSNNLIITYNGSSLTPNQDYSLSNIDKNKIRFNNVIFESGDTITVSYPAQNDSIITMTSVSETVNWTIQNTIPINETGYFNIEFSNNVNFNSIVCTSNNINYISGQNNYSENIDITLTPYTSLTLNTTYYGRIKSTRFYTTVNGDNIETNIYSDYFLIKTAY
jgi:hypothetical protein